MNILIIGMGDVGLHLAKRLVAQHDVTLIDRDHQRVMAVSNLVDAICIEGNASCPSTLKKAGIQTMDILAAMTSSDELNILACELGKYFGVETTICRIRNHELATFEGDNPIRRFGVDYLIHPEKETADAIVGLIRQDVPSDAITIAEGKVQLTSLTLHRDSPFVKVPLQSLREEHEDLPFRVVSIHRKNTTFIPRGTDMLLPADKAYLLCEPGRVAEIFRIAGKTPGNIEHVMLLGGGLISQYVARDLSGECNVKIIESNASKSEEISDLLPDSLIIHGDGTDIDLLGVEGIIDMDAFIAATGSDEVNIISTLVARHLKVSRTVALVNKVDYMPITPTIGMDAVVSREMLTVNRVLHYIHRKGRSGPATATIPGIPIRVMEIPVSGNCKASRKPLNELKFPKNATVAAVVNGDKVTIAHGSTQLAEGDLAVVLAMPGVEQEVKRMFR